MNFFVFSIILSKEKTLKCPKMENKKNLMEFIDAEKCVVVFIYKSYLSEKSVVCLSKNALLFKVQRLLFRFWYFLVSFWKQILKNLRFKPSTHWYVYYTLETYLVSLHLYNYDQRIVFQKSIGCADIYIGFWQVNLYTYKDHARTNQIFGNSSLNSAILM